MGLRDLRIARGMTQRQLAEKVGLYAGRISDYETGMYDPENMTLALAIRYADALGVRDLRKLVEPDVHTSGRLPKKPKKQPKKKKR